jgi:mono/diheme cytochrome c family protein
VAQWEIGLGSTILVAGLCAAAGVGAVRAQDGGAGHGPSDADVKAELMDEGQSVYGTNCLECHEGGAGPSLAANADLSNKDTVVKRILRGSDNGDMSEFGSTLTDREVAAVATYVRNSFDNMFGIVLETDVKKVRDEPPRK